MKAICVRHAFPDEAVEINNLLGKLSENGVLLPRTIQEILENIRDFFVILKNDKIVGCTALKIYDQNIAEIRSLVVIDKERGNGLGKLLINECEKEAKAFKIKKIFALTYVHEFFIKENYEVIDKESLPQKIWRDCLECPKFPNCNETAVIKDC